ncbi:MAG: Caffeine dehydrogenase subunit beta [bacterium ADurb.Bin363]|nr:MAG: Caffeine dehydrogenase subunit beta [bacterium ADurb.Bin363]
MKNLKEFYYPSSLTEALYILSENEDNSLINVPVAGSTSIVFSKNPNIKGLIDINRIGLDYIKKDGTTIKIGSTMTARKIYQSPLIKSMAGGLLAKAAGSIGSTLIRNSCTIGGNIVDLRIWSDFPAPLLALDAKIKVDSKKGTREISVEEFFSKRPSKILSPSEMVTEIIIPSLEGKGSFIKFARTRVDYTLVDIAAYLETEDKKICLARIAVSGITTLPERLKSMEKFIEGKELTEDFLQEVSKKAREECVEVRSET